jgi:hypothetical protein
MKLVTVAAMTFVFLIAGGSQCTETGLVGCPNPIDVAKGLRNLQQNNWTTISVERVISIWPNRFDELACERKNGCRLLVSKNRVIGGHCECCEAFVFDTEQKGDGPRINHLNNIIIHYSSRSREKVVDAGRTFAEAAGLPRTEVAKVGTDSPQRYEWRDSATKQSGQSYILELRITRADRNWELYLSLGAEAL